MGDAPPTNTTCVLQCTQGEVIMHTHYITITEHPPLPQFSKFVDLLVHTEREHVPGMYSKNKTIKGDV